MATLLLDHSTTTPCTGWTSIPGSGGGCPECSTGEASLPPFSSRHFDVLLQGRVSEQACFEAAPAMGIIFLEPASALTLAPASANMNI